MQHKAANTDIKYKRKTLKGKECDRNRFVAGSKQLGGMDARLSCGQLVCDDISHIEFGVMPEFGEPALSTTP